MDPLLAGLAQSAQRFELPGPTIWHAWGEGPALVLLHGGAGSWRHWVRNIAAFARDHRVLAPDLPGLGESADPPAPASAASIAAIVAAGLATLLPAGAPYDLVGFSFGGVIAGSLALLDGARLRSLTIVGSGGLGLARNVTELVKVRHLTGAARAAAHATNLARLMIADPARIDPLAVDIQDWNTVRSRLKTPLISRGTALRDALARVPVRLNGIYGERDQTAWPAVPEREALFRALHPDVGFRIIPGAGHWVAYEAAEAFNAALRELLAREYALPGPE